MFKLTLLSVAALAVSLVTAETAYFAFKTQDNTSDFIFELNDDATIAHARKILSGQEKDKVIVTGWVVKTPEPYNPNWHFHLDPETIGFVGRVFKKCNVPLAVVEKRLDEVCDTLLPHCFYCPQTARLTREVKHV